MHLIRAGIIARSRDAVNGWDVGFADAERSMVLHFPTQVVKLHSSPMIIMQVIHNQTNQTKLYINHIHVNGTLSVIVGPGLPFTRTMVCKNSSSSCAKTFFPGAAAYTKEAPLHSFVDGDFPKKKKKTPIPSRCSVYCDCYIEGRKRCVYKEPLSCSNARGKVSSLRRTCGWRMWVREVLVLEAEVANDAPRVACKMRGGAFGR